MENWFGVTCDDERAGCGACIIADGRDEAIAAWNTRAAPPAMDREALQKGLEFAVLTLAFYGRDRGTDREAKMLNDLEQLARELDPLMRQAIASLESRSGHPDDAAVDQFAIQMKAKMAASRAKGRGGWDDPAQCSADYLRTLLHEHVAKGDPVDVANFCMMLAHYGASTTLSADTIRQGEALPQSFVTLVIAAREAFDTGMLPQDEQGALDKALEPFASSVSYANEPASHASDGGK